MQTDKELFDLIKETYPLNPSKDFIESTEHKLRKTAKKLNRKRMGKHLSFAFSGVILFILSVSWLFLFDGKAMVMTTLNSFRENNAVSLVDDEEPLVFIYHTHNTEGFLSETNKNNPSEVFHDTKNITLVGNKLNEALKEKNINSIQDNSNVNGILEERGLYSNESYIISGEVLKDALKRNKSIKMAFDIHRDSSNRNVTTQTLNGIDYARISFIISRSNSNYKDNLEFAKLLHTKLEEKYPGLSRGILEKSNENVSQQSTYNQELLKQSVLLEVGGIENTLEEEYRTVNIFAEIIAENMDKLN
ncbi:stage II sporulation protein P [Psychrobacillus vulpis]|uniref:Stage II sporulation protein P n=1 Tax=Psychrobacillus vulpis TaxID=2325572 RepID=A0A544TTQ2_9BACI|nr:stage II sporulation protein P [Psychrobacillus vulpis]TQR20804.1 stage II sporulation protein P [Psychrobacillus vulpis]